MKPHTTLAGARRAAGAALAAASLALAASPPANAAAVFLIDATTDGLAPSPSLGNVGFSLTYEDFNADLRFSLNELLAFTGVFDTGGNYFDLLLGLPTLPGLVGTGSAWQFGDSTATLPSYTTPAAMFTPFTTVLVPEPASLALVALGLAGLGLASRRRGDAAVSAVPAD